MTVFIADDSENVRKSLKDALYDIGASVLGETDKISEVLHAVRELAPDFVILDLRMSDGNSFGLIREIKQSFPEMKLAVFTEYSYDLYRQRCLELGADYFFEKSMESEKLIKTIQQCNG